MSAQSSQAASAGSSSALPPDSDEELFVSRVVDAMAVQQLREMTFRWVSPTIDEGHHREGHPQTAISLWSFVSTYPADTVKELLGVLGVMLEKLTPLHDADQPSTIFMDVLRTVAVLTSAAWSCVKPQDPESLKLINPIHVLLMEVRTRADKSSSTEVQDVDRDLAKMKF